jgi:APA family basic amino acid/polyamine antiporter
MTKLVREVALPGAVLLGLGSMLGTGVYATLGLAIPRAGHAWELALVIATMTALCSGLSSARLAARYPVSGGTYVYGCEVLRPAVGFAAGWLFLVAKSASAAAAVLACALLVPGELPAPGVFGPLIAVALASVANAGLRRGNRLNAVLVGISLVGLAAFVVWALSSPVPLAPPDADAKPPAPREIFLAAALLFVAFTGYGRVATMGEEIREPARNIPRAVVVTVLVAGLVYGLVASAGAGRFVAVAAEFDSDADIDSLTLQALTEVGGAPGWVRACLACGAVTALLGVAFNLILGLSRVVLAMARRGDLPGGLGRIDVRRNNPARAVWMVLGLVLVFSLVGVRFAWEVSAGSVLLYYGITNLCALRLPDPPPMTRPVAMLGLVSCFHLAFHVPWRALVLVAGILLVGFVLRAVIRPVEEPDFDASAS